MPIKFYIDFTTIHILLHHENCTFTLLNLKSNNLSNCKTNLSHAEKSHFVKRIKDNAQGRSVAL